VLDELLGHPAALFEAAHQQHSAPRRDASEPPKVVPIRFLTASTLRHIGHEAPARDYLVQPATSGLGRHRQTASDEGTHRRRNGAVQQLHGAIWLGQGWLLEA
jgi:hypothetical protein